MVTALHSTNSIMGEWASAVTLWMSGAMDMTKHANRLALSGVAGWGRRMVVVALLGAAACSWAADPPPPPQNVMSLAASASMEVTLDQLTVVLTAVKEGAEAPLVQTQLRLALDAALAEARKAVRPGQLEVRTGVFSLVPRYGPKAGNLVGWVGRAELVIQGRDLQAVGQMAGRLNTMSVSSASYSLSREALENAEAEVTARAITRFRERALTQAQGFGFSSFTIREVQVGTPDQPVTDFRPMPRLMSVASGAPPPEAAIPVEAGKTQVATTVTGSVQMQR